MPKKILIIDDEELIIKTFAMFLEKKGFNVEVAKRYEDAIILAENEDYDLIICDIRMPGQNGVQTINQIRGILKDQNRKQPAVIFISGFADEKLKEEAKKLDYTAFLYKPFESEKFIHAIEEGLKK